MSTEGLEDNEWPCYLGRVYHAALQMLSGEDPLPIERVIPIEPERQLQQDRDVSPEDCLEWPHRTMCRMRVLPPLETIVSIKHPASGDIYHAETAITPALKIMDQWPTVDNQSAAGPEGEKEESIIEWESRVIEECLSRLKHKERTHVKPRRRHGHDLHHNRFGHEPSLSGSHRSYVSFHPSMHRQGNR